MLSHVPKALARDITIFCNLVLIATIWPAAAKGAVPLCGLILRPVASRGASCRGLWGAEVQRALSAFEGALLHI